MACKGSSSCVVNVDAFIMVGLVSFSGNPFFGRAIFFLLHFSGLPRYLNGSLCLILFLFL